MDPSDRVLSVRIKGDKEGPQTGDVVLNGSSLNEFHKNGEYEKGDVVVVDGQLWQSNVDQVAGDYFDRTKWTQVGIPDLILDPFERFHAYAANQIIVHENKIYMANEDFTSANAFYPDDWTELGAFSFNFVSGDNSVIITQTEAGTWDFNVGIFVDQSLRTYNDKLEKKVDKVEGKQLSTNDFSNEEQQKLRSLPGITRLGDNLHLNDGVLSASFTPVYDATLDEMSSNAVQNKVLTSTVETLKIEDQNLEKRADRAEERLNGIDTSVININSGITSLQGNIQTINLNLDTKVDKVDGKELSTNDYSNADKSKLQSLLSIYGLGPNVYLEDGVISATDTITELESSTGTSVTKGMTQRAITDALKEKVDTTSLSAVATSGEYSDLKNTPKNISSFTNDTKYQTQQEVKASIDSLEEKIVPLIKDNRITIKNGDGINYGSFSLNQSTDQEITISKATAATAGVVKVDATLDKSSTNPVRNNAVATAIEKETTDRTSAINAEKSARETAVADLQKQLNDFKSEVDDKIGDLASILERLDSGEGV